MRHLSPSNARPLSIRIAPAADVAGRPACSPAAARAGARQALRSLRTEYNRALDEHAGKLAIPIEIGIDATSSAFVDSEAYSRARAALAELTALEAEYFRQLPRLPLSRCPLCDKALYRSFDPFGIDGLWWRSDSQPEEPQPCPHFCVVLGAVDISASASAPDFDVYPGPGIPFLLPRLLEHEGMVAVVSALALADGATAYPIAYFAPRRPPVQALTAAWARTNFVYTTQLGVHGYRCWSETPTGAGAEAWDYDLERWLSQGKLRWCMSGAHEPRLVADSTLPCPFVGLPGPRHAQLVCATNAAP